MTHRRPAPRLVLSIFVAVSASLVAPSAWAQEETLAHALRLSMGFGYGHFSFGDSDDIPADFYADHDRADHQSGALALDLGVDYIHGSGHGAFLHLWGFTELTTPDLQIDIFDSNAEPATYNYGGGGLTAGYRYQFRPPSKRGVHFVPSVMAGPALGWLGYAADEGHTGCGLFCDENDDGSVIPVGPERDHFGMGLTAGGAAEFQLGRAMLGVAVEYTHLWTVTQTERSHVAGDSVLRLFFRAGVVLG